MKKKFFAMALATTMIISTTMTAMSAEVDESKTYETAQTIDGRSGWNTKDGDNYLISAVPVTVKFVNNPFTRATGTHDNWDNFVVETVASATVKGVTLRADNYGWTYGDATVEPTINKENMSWTDWTKFQTMCLANTNVSVTAKKVNETNVEFKIDFGSAETEVYTITYANGVPDDLRFHVGADGGSIDVTEVVYGAEPSVYVQYKEQTDGNYTVRVVGEVSLEGTFAESVNNTYNGVGFRCAKSASAVATAESYASTVVFKSLVAKGVTLASADGKYFVVTEITDVAKDATIYASPVYVKADKTVGTFTDKEYTIKMADIIK